MIALIRKNLRLWGYGNSLALFTGCILFSISGRLNGGIAYERHILSAVSDHYYLTYFVLPIVLLGRRRFCEDMVLPEVPFQSDQFLLIGHVTVNAANDCLVFRIAVKAAEVDPVNVHDRHVVPPL